MQREETPCMVHGWCVLAGWAFALRLGVYCFAASLVFVLHAHKVRGNLGGRAV